MELKKIISASLLSLFFVGAAVGNPSPNILLIAIDDLNDWVGCLGGHPQAKTPNIDRLAARGVLFSNAQCQAPVCNPSRASMMSGLYPETTGIYFLSPPPLQSSAIHAAALMPQRFLDEGYSVSGAGKLFHNGENQNETYIPNYGGQFGAFGPYRDKKLTTFPGEMLWDWGVFPERDDQMPDFKIASWAEARLGKDPGQPFWLGVGFYRPHVPLYAPKKWFDLYPLDTLKLPETLTNDLDDLSEYAIDLTRLKHISPTMEWVRENNQWKPLVQAYLACISFVDHQVGRVLDALDASPFADNTIVVLYSDHGFHLGEKEHFAKRTLWQDGAGVPLVIAGPGIAGGRTCDKPVQLIDLYPTLLDLAGLKADPRLEGHSLKPLLENPRAKWPYLVRTSFGPGNVAIVSEHYRYIRYNDGSEELYDRQADPNEWHNLAHNPEMKAVLEAHRMALPHSFHKLLGEGSTGHRAYEATERRRELREKKGDRNSG